MIFPLFFYAGDALMKNQEKMWYTIEESLTYLHLEEPVFWRKMTFFHMGTRALPGMKGLFISRRDLLFLEQRIQTTGQNQSK